MKIADPSDDVVTTGEDTFNVGAVAPPTAGSLRMAISGGGAAARRSGQSRSAPFRWAVGGQRD